MNSRQPSKSRGGAFAVGAGILLSRLMGLMRERVLAHALGVTDAAGAFRAALKIPNLLQNLFGEGALSASLIPEYAKILAQGRAEDASRLAGVIFSFLFLVVGVIAACGMLLAEPIVSIIVPGFRDETKVLTVQLVRIIFPGTGFLVLSAWCLGVLNSHRKFFLSYVSPVIWNAAIITGLLFASGSALFEQRAMGAAWGVLVGSILQFMLQLPTVLQLNHRVLFGSLKPSGAIRTAALKVGKNAVPAVISRGVVQISAFIDQVLSSLIGPQMVAVTAFAQTVFLLPVSLFGMSIAAAELPELAGSVGSGGNQSQQGSSKAIAQRLSAALDRLDFFIVPSTMALLAIGDAIGRVLFKSGNFGSNELTQVWAVMAAMAIGLPATTRSRLYTSAFWAIGATAVTARIAATRVAISALLGAFVVLYLRHALAWSDLTAASALAICSAIASWLEKTVLRVQLKRQVGAIISAPHRLLKLWFAAVFAGAIAQLSSRFGLQVLPGGFVNPAIDLVIGSAIIVIFTLVYGGVCWWLRIPEAIKMVQKIKTKLRL